MTKEEAKVLMLAKQTITQGKYACKECNMRFDNPVKLRYHRKECPGESLGATYKISRFTRKYTQR